MQYICVVLVVIDMRCEKSEDGKHDFENLFKDEVVSLLRPRLGHEIQKDMKEVFERYSNRLSGSVKTIQQRENISDEMIEEMLEGEFAEEWEDAVSKAQEYALDTEHAKWWKFDIEHEDDYITIEYFSGWYWYRFDGNDFSFELISDIEKTIADIEAQAKQSVMREDYPLLIESIEVLAYERGRAEVLEEVEKIINELVKEYEYDVYVHKRGMIRLDTVREFFEQKLEALKAERRVKSDSVMEKDSSPSGQDTPRKIQKECNGLMHKFEHSPFVRHHLGLEQSPQTSTAISLSEHVHETAEANREKQMAAETVPYRTPVIEFKEGMPDIPTTEEQIKEAVEKLKCGDSPAMENISAGINGGAEPSPRPSEQPNANIRTNTPVTPVRRTACGSAEKTVRARAFIEKYGGKFAVPKDTGQLYAKLADTSLWIRKWFLEEELEIGLKIDINLFVDGLLSGFAITNQYRIIREWCVKACEEYRAELARLRNEHGKMQT